MKLSFLLSFLGMFLIGGVITGNILGDMKNKTAEVVFFMWKGIQVFRKRVIPSNPQTQLQTQQRVLFTAVLRVAQALLLSVIKPFWKPYAIKKSEYNAFMQHNLNVVSAPIDYEDLELAKGNIQNTPVTDAVYDHTTGQVDVNFVNSIEGSQKSTDIPYAAIYDPTSELWYVNVAGSGTRADGKLAVQLGAGIYQGDIAKSVAYLWFTDVAVTINGFDCSGSSSIHLTYV
jgi:hypothetical protein